MNNVLGNEFEIKGEDVELITVSASSMCISLELNSGICIVIPLDKKNKKEHKMTTCRDTVEDMFTQDATEGMHKQITSAKKKRYKSRPSHGRRNKKWTKAEDESLSLLKNQGMSGEKMGKILSRSTQSIHNRIYTLSKK